MFELTGNKNNRRKTCRKCRGMRFQFNVAYRNTQDRRKYGITREKIGPNICMICGSTETICIDHCHETGKVRGLLCRKCNTGIGMLGDTLVQLRLAVKYLENSLEVDYG
jgi:hypothetical protein